MLIRNLVVASVCKIYMIDGAVLTKIKNLPLVFDHPVLQKFFALIQIWNGDSVTKFDRRSRLVTSFSVLVVIAASVLEIFAG